jgi:hypothetical protein
VALLARWPDGDHLRQVSRDLSAGPAAPSVSGSFIKAGQILWTTSDNAHLRELGQGLIVLGSDLALERPASGARMQRLWDVQHLVWAVKVGCEPADLSEHTDLIPASQRLDWLQAATSALARLGENDLAFSPSLATSAHLFHEALQAFKEQPTRRRLTRADQNANEERAADMLTVAGDQHRLIIAPHDPRATDLVLEPETYTRMDEGVDRLTAAAFLVLLEGPYWSPNGRKQANNLLQQAHTMLADLADSQRTDGRSARDQR